MKDFDFKKLNKKYNNGTIYWAVDSDEDSDRLMEEGIPKRDSYYTKLLRNYWTLTRFRNFVKEIHKWLFFWFIIVVLIFVCFRLTNYIDIILSYLQKSPNEYTVSLITSIISLVSTVISIPIIITKYLFNNKEDDNITTIISKTQEHDNIELSLLKERFAKSKETNDKDTLNEDVNEDDNNSNKAVDLLQQLMKKLDE